MTYIILGMHKSGTTMITKILHESGIEMGPFKQKGEYYKGEDCERMDAFQIVSDMLNSHDLHSLDTIPPFDETLIRKNVNRLGDLIRTSESNGVDWGFKNPRTVFVYEQIKPVLGRHKLIGIYRPLRDVVTHYSQNSISNIPKAIKAWKAYNRIMVEIIRKSDLPWVVLEFEKFFDGDGEFKRLEEFVQKDLKDLRKKESRRKSEEFNKIMSDLTVSWTLMFDKEAREITDALNELAGQPQSTKVVQV